MEQVALNRHDEIVNAAKETTGRRKVSRKIGDAIEESSVPLRLCDSVCEALPRMQSFALRDTESRRHGVSMCYAAVLLVAFAAAFASRVEAQAVPPQAVRVWCEVAGGWLEARGATVWLVVEGRAEVSLLRARGRVVDLSVASGNRPLVAMALAGAKTQGVVVARFTPASGRTRQRLRIVGGGVEPHRSPWRVSWGDVDGDNREDLLVGVVGRARFDPVERKRPFVYTWDGRRLVPKWLGSRLSRPFSDIALGNADEAGRCDLVALELTRDGGLEVTIYSWKGFGFERRFASSRISAPASLGRSRDGRILLDADGQVSIVTVRDGLVLISPTESP